MKKYFLLLALALPFFLSAQHSFNSYLKESAAYREHPLDMLHMKLEVEFVPEQGLVKGIVTHRFISLQDNVDSVFLDAPSIRIESVTMNKQSLRFRTDKIGVWIFFNHALQHDQNGEFSIKYEANASRGIYFIGWNEPLPAKPDPFAVRRQIWTQGQGIDNRQWIPMYDDMNDKFITETLIKFDRSYEVLSNGTLLDKKENKDGSTSWHYSMKHPHSGYLLMIAIGHYAVGHEKSKSGVPLNYWYYPEFSDRMAPTYRFTPAMIDFLEEETGQSYPWESYSQVMVQDFIYGAMENTTATVFGDFFNVDERAYADRSYVGVNCHEMTHQWFGDFVTARDGRDTWLQESFATFFPKQFSKRNEGFDEWCWQRRQHQNAAIDAGKKDNFPVRHTQGGTARVYPKGAAVLSMLEYVLGHDAWKRALTHYLHQHAYSNVETNDLQQAIKDKLGLNLDWFFDEWIYRGGEPNYEVSYEEISAGSKEAATLIRIRQTHTTSETVHTFKMPVKLEVHYADQSCDSVMQTISEASEEIRIPNSAGKKIDFVLFDPCSNILKQLSFKKSFEELGNQASKAANMLDRYDALVALRETDLAKKRELLLHVLKHETHYGIINEIVNQLINDSNATTKSAMQDLMKNRYAAVRNNVLQGLSHIDESWKPRYVSALEDSSYEVVKTALDKLCTQFPGEAKTHLEKVKGVAGMNHAVTLKRLEFAINLGIDRDASTAELVKYASTAYEFRTRNNAFATLKSVNYLDKEVVKNLFQAVCSWNARLAGPAAELCNYYSAQAPYRNMMQDSFSHENLTQKQREALQKQISWLK